MSAVEALLDALPRLALVVGKGGVGKTTCAAALALRAAARGEATLVLSTDPAATLGDALGATLAAGPMTVPGMPGLDACQLDAAALRDAFLGRWRETIVAIVDRGTYLDTEDIAGLVDAAFPGADEIFAVLHLAELERTSPYRRIVVDTAPTGHTLRLLALPRTFEALVALLDRMQEKHRFMVRTLTRRYRADAADAFIAQMDDEVRGFREALADPARCAAVLVTRPEPVVAAETARYAGELRLLGVAVAAVVVNVAVGDGRVDEVDVPLRLLVPPLEETPVGRDGLAAWGAAVIPGGGRGAPGVEGSPSLSGPRSTRRGATRGFRPRRAPLEDAGGSLDAGRSLPSAGGDSALVRPLTIVGGKGGVGKTTVSCVLAVAAADAGHVTLLVSTDPAPSVADVLELAVGEAETPIADVPGLVARQMDAGAAFARLRARYEERIDALFASIVARGVDVAHDRAVLRELMALAPPGIDELYALAELGETLAEGRFARVVVDPAPTGHLLRLLEMPALALEWTHRLMRLMIKYREVAGLGEAAQELLAFSRRTRALDALARDAARAGVLLVALDEPLVRGETSRLRAAVDARGLDVIGVLWNRVSRPPAPLPFEPRRPQFAAPLVDPPPVGAGALRRWAAAWTGLDPTHG